MIPQSSRSAGGFWLTAVRPEMDRKLDPAGLTRPHSAVGRFLRSCTHLETDTNTL